MELDTKGKRNSARLLAEEIAAKESPEDTDTNDSVIAAADVTMSESGQHFLQVIGVTIHPLVDPHNLNLINRSWPSDRLVVSLISD